MVPPRGSPTVDVPLVAAGGMVFTAAPMDPPRARLADCKGDAATGGKTWSNLVAAPAVFTRHGVDYVVFTAGGNSILTPQVSDQAVAHHLLG